MDYITFGHSNFKKYFSKRIFFVKENETSFGIFGNNLFVEMEILGELTIQL